MLKYSSFNLEYADFNNINPNNTLKDENNIYTKKFIFKLLDNKIENIEFKNINSNNYYTNELYAPIIINDKELNCNDVILNALKLNKSVKHITFSNCEVTNNKFFERIFKNYNKFKNYTKLNLNHSINKSEELYKLLKIYPNITTLQLNNNQITEIDDNIINTLNNSLIEELIINNTNIFFITKLLKSINLTSIKKLNFNYNDIMNVDILKPILQNNKIESLELSFNRINNINQINDLIYNCPHLNYLDISMNYISDINMLNKIKLDFPNIDFKV